MKKRIAIIVCILLCLLSLWVACKVAGLFLEIHTNVKLANRIHDQLLKPEVYTPAALRLANLFQAGDTNQYEMFTNLVPRVPGDYFGQCWATFNADEIHVEFGGGFWHFGYKLKRDAINSSAETNYWFLDLYAEGQTNKELLHFAMPISQVQADLKKN
jgi:hypothetical protein